MNQTEYDRIINVRELDLIRRALVGAKDEIHNPGCARASNYDVLDLIDQALAMPLLGAGTAELARRISGG